MLSSNKLRNQIEDAHKQALLVAANLKFDFSFYVDQKGDFEEVKLFAHSTEPYRTGIQFYAFKSKCYLHGDLVAQAQHSSLEDAIPALVALVASGEAKIDTLQVWAPDLLSVDHPSYQLVRSVIEAHLGKSDLNRASQQQEISNLTPSSCRQMLLRRRLLELLSSGTGNWNARPIAERILVDWRQSMLAHCQLAEADFSQLDFSKSTFQQSDLSCSVLSRASFHNANFQEAKLRGAELKGMMAKETNFCGANFRDANASYAHLKQCDLRACNFSNANLSYADLSLSDLRGTDFSEANFKSIKLKSVLYDEKTKFPDNFALRAQMIWKGEEADPFMMAKIAPALSTVKPVKFSGLLKYLSEEFGEPERVAETLNLLQKEEHLLYCEILDTSVLAVCRSKKANAKFFGCYLKADGMFACYQENLKRCPGVGTMLCKHILLLLLALVKANELDASEALRWIIATKIESKPKWNSEPVLMAFDRCKAARDGTAYWSPLETNRNDFADNDLST